MENIDEATIRVRNEELFKVWSKESNRNDKISAVQTYILTEFNEDDLPQDFVSQIEERSRKLCGHISSKWQGCNRTLERFQKKHAEWLKSETFFEKVIGAKETQTNTPGRPRLDYKEKSARSRRRVAAELSAEKDHESRLMVEAASIAARRKGESDLSAVLKETTKSPTRPSKMRRLVFAREKPHLQYTPEEALAYLLDNSLRKQQYLNTRHGAISKNCDMYPSYEKILEAKSACRVNGLSVTDTSAKVPLRNLLEHTVKRIVLLQEEPIISALESNNSNTLHAQMIFSYGFDGSSGQSNYKQKCDTPGTSGTTDSCLFATTVIPLRLVTENNVILWNNQTPQSVRFCRPLKLEYVKETREHILKEKESLDKQISNLSAIDIEMSNNKVLSIEYKLFMTIIDGKVFNILTGTKSNQSCPICGATPVKFLEIKDFKSEIFHPKPNTLQYGISPSHCWIRFFECVLHLSYKHEIKKWQVRQDVDKRKLKERKQEIQKRFWEKMSLHVDKPKANGSGSTNDGNTIRRAFSQPDLFSKITDVNQELIKNFQIILIALTCQYPLNLNVFETFCFQTARLYMENYTWCPMTATVHKVLIHGKQILNNTVLPVGYFGEDAAESRNKLYKQDREFHARKSTSINNLQDVFNRAIDTSDPVISSIRLKNRLETRRRLNLPAEVINLLCIPESEPEPSTSSFEPDADDLDAEECDESSFSCNLEQLHQLELDSE